MSDREAEHRSLRMALGEAQGEAEKLRPLKKKYEEQGRKLQGVEGAARELLNELDRFLVEESGCIYELRTAISLLRGAL